MARVSYGFPSKIQLAGKPKEKAKSLSIHLDFRGSQAIEFDLTPVGVAALILNLQRMQKRHGWPVGLTARPSTRRDLN
jgi:hypothetical protein